MSIPEKQLETWANQGAQTISQNTYNSIKTALANHTWPNGMNHEVYLQGSYPNATNIYGDSDVDIVVESSNVFYHDLPSDLQQSMGLFKSSYEWTDFRDEVKKALSNHYGTNKVSQANKCIKVKGDGGNRLNADVVPCCTYKHYRGTTLAAVGITFWTQSRQQVVNFPKLHLNNGQSKNFNCSYKYKPNIRVFKNARNKAQTNNPYPSYFLECLFYNVPSSNFSHTHTATYLNCTNWLSEIAQKNQLDAFLCQNGVQLMFGSGLHQSNTTDARRLITDLITLWNQWGS